MRDWSDWQDALTALGLTPRTGILLGARVAGTVDGKQVELDYVTSPIVRVPIEPSLDLGLIVEPEGMLTVPKVPTGDREFDGLFSVIVDEPRRAAELLTPPILTALVTLLGRSTSVQLTDEVVAVRGEGGQWLRLAVLRAVEIAHHIDGHRRHLRIAAPLEGVRPALAQFAALHALRIDDNPLRLWGTARGVQVQAVCAREGYHRIAMTVHLRLADSLGLDLRLERTRLLTPLVALLPGQMDHRVGEAAFDAAFHVRTNRPDLISQVLEPRTRAALMVCAGGSRSLTVDDSGLVAVVPVVDHGPAPLEVLRAGLDAVARLASAVRAAPTPKPQGPFR